MLERAINGLSPAERLAARRNDIAPLVDDLIDWMRQERAKLSRHNDVAKAVDYMLKRIDAFTRFLDDGRICLSNNAAERAHLFAGSDVGAERWATLCSLIETCKMHDVEPYAYLRHVLQRMVDGYPVNRLDELLPWNWKPPDAVKS